MKGLSRLAAQLGPVALARPAPAPQRALAARPAQRLPFRLLPPVVLLALAAALALTGCASSGPRDEAAQVEVIARGFQERADMVNRADVQGLIDFWCDNGINLANGKAPVTGKETLATQTRANWAATTMSNRVHELKEVRVFSDEWAMMWGLYHDERTPKAGGPTRKYYGKVLLILHREPDGSWKKYIDIANDDAPPR
jgi:ketosteroid isomerase-like protein